MNLAMLEDTDVLRLGMSELASLSLRFASETYA